MDSTEEVLAQKHYYHSTLPREETENLLKHREDGTFLLRKSLRRNDSYVISISYRGDCLHYSIDPIQRDGRTMYSVNNGTPFPNPWEVCEHYMAMQGGLKVQLRNPIFKNLTGASAYVLETDWFHNDITREEDSRRLSQGYRLNRSDGIFLVRRKDTNMYVLSAVNSGRVHRYIINQIPATGHFCISGKKREFPSMEDLVSFHRANPPSVTGIQCQLAAACPKSFGEKKRTGVPLVRNSINPATANRFSGLSPQLNNYLPDGSFDMTWDPDRSQHDTAMTNPKEEWDIRRTKAKSWLKEFTLASTNMPEDCPGFNSIYQNCAGKDGSGVAKDLYVKESDISVYEELGKGHFGSVCLGRCKISGEAVTCAIKFLKGTDVVTNKQQLLEEAALMQDLDHPNIMRLIAVCDTDTDLMMLLELAPIGTFKKFLKRHNETSFPESKILNIVNQVLHGMAYLASKNIVHRDLALRNVLLVSENFAKVSDFGMSKVLKESENYYRSARPGSWPLKWYSPEALCYYKFTTKCDVWSYGVTLWEAFSYGSRPYRGMKGREILEMLERNERLDCPIACPPDVYDLMLYCWTYEADQRPSFDQLVPIMKEIMKNVGLLSTSTSGVSA
uniref:tyrosine-protein kinase ZAP-70-like n=2 Tax=Styela clava TaxID=7725 RepID=UPI001939C882|nr:tyrosine-protein kinase ZAP-70-like [Styela clava]